MKITIAFSTFLCVSAALWAQSAVSTADGKIPNDLAKIPPASLTAGSTVTENTVNGIPLSDYVGVQTALAETLDDPEVAKLTAQIEKLMDERDELLFAIATKKHPEKAKHIKSMGDAIREQKNKRGKSKG